MANINMVALLLNFSSRECKNKTETIICKTILDHIDTIHTISAEKLAQLSHTSVASITRLMHHFPVKSYREFVVLLSASYQNLSIARQRNHQMLLGYGLEGIVDYTKTRYEENLQENHIDDHQIEHFIQTIINASSVTFIGASHSLEIFAKIQLALIKKHKKAFIFKQESMLKEHLQHLDTEDLIIFLSLQNRYLDATGASHLEYIESKNIPCILISQKKCQDEKRFQQVIYFGKDDDWNYGYYSMIMLANHLEIMISQNL